VLESLGHFDNEFGGVLVKVLRVGVDGTDKEINAAEYRDLVQRGLGQLRHLPVATT
jgi:hypothetical protein